MQTTINGQSVPLGEPHPDHTAVDLIRQQCGLTGTKLVCGGGVCGACTVLVDGQPMTSCLLPADHLDGRTVETVEQYQGDTLHPVQKAFMAHDGVQCGFCTPGFIMESIAFYEKWRVEHGRERPPKEEIAEALAGHLCRCGAYLGIYTAVQTACAGEFDDVPLADVSAQRVDALEKVTGQAKYTADIQLAGQLVGRILRSPHGHARVRSLDFTAAEALPGVRAVVRLLSESDPTVRYAGQEIAAVAADDWPTAVGALQAIQVSYELLPVLTDPTLAQHPDAFDIWAGHRDEAPIAAEGLSLPGSWQGNLRKGRINFGGLLPSRAQSAYEQAGGSKISASFYNTTQVHTAFEPHGAVAHWLPDSYLEVYISTQAVSSMHKEIAHHFDLSPDKVRVLAHYVGGGFGGKNSFNAEIIAAVALAKKAQAPVSVMATRAEELTVGGLRPGGRVDLQLATQRNGDLAALKTHFYNEGGVAVATLKSALAGQGYKGGARDLLDYDVVTNQPPGKPFRAPGGLAVCWAIEQAADQIAHEQGLDPVTLRRRWNDDALRRQLYDWVDSLPVWRERETTGSQHGRYRRGVGVAFGQWLYLYDPATEIRLDVTPQGLSVATATQDIGNGVRTTLARTVAEVFGLAPREVQVVVGDSKDPHGPTAGGSRVTNSVFAPTREAAVLMRDRLFGLIAEVQELEAATAVDGGIQHQNGFLTWADIWPQVAPQSVSIQRGTDSQLSQRIGHFVLSRIMGADFTMGAGNAHGAVVAEVEVDTLLGKTRVRRIWENIAAGKIHVPDLARSQVYGGVAQGLGYALYEEKVIDRQTGHNLTQGLEDYRLMGIGDMPEVDVTFIEEGFEQAKGGGIGLAELAITPVPAAVANAVFNATGWRPLTNPIQPERLLMGLQAQEA